MAMIAAMIGVIESNHVPPVWVGVAALVTMILVVEVAGGVVDETTDGAVTVVAEAVV